MQKAYWRGVGAIDPYWDAEMELLSKNPQFSLYSRIWLLHSHDPPLLLATFVDSGERKVKIKGSLISGDSYIQGSTIYKSDLGFRSNIATGSLISESVILGDVKVGAGCSIREPSSTNRLKSPRHYHW